MPLTLPRRRLLGACGLAALLAAATPAAGQTPPTLDDTTRDAVLAAVAREMTERYVFPEVAEQVRQALADPSRRKPWRDTRAPEAFAQQLTDWLQALTRDKHLRVRYSAMPLPERPQSDDITPEELARERQDDAWRNHGVEKVERLPGNIGLLVLNSFSPASWAGGTLAAAMTVLAQTDSLIIDLRRNGGGDPATVALLSSYLFDERTHLNDLVWRQGPRTEQFWTQDWVPGLRYGGQKPVYVLTSSRTFSGAEEFSYNLRNLKRATLVGETTGGGANPGDTVRLQAHFSMFVPMGRAHSPVTGTNWEGSGVTPHVAVPADDALRQAQLLALPPLIGALPDPERQQALRNRLQQLAQGTTAPARP